MALPGSTATTSAPGDRRPCRGPHPAVGGNRRRVGARRHLAVGQRVRAMNDGIRDRLAEQAWGVLVAAARDGVTDPNLLAHAIVGNQLPVVRQLIADELRRMAGELVKDGRPDLTHIAAVEAVSAAADMLDARADAIHPDTGDKP